MVDWTHEQPVFFYVRELTRRYFPEVEMAWSDEHNTADIRTAGVGGFKNRLTAHGTRSRHAEGRGCDIYFYTNQPQLLRFGLALFDQLAANAVHLGIEDLIYYTRIWSVAVPSIHATDVVDMNNHRDHLHVGFSRAASQSRPPLLESLFQEARRIGLGTLHGSALGVPPRGIRGSEL